MNKTYRLIWSRSKEKWITVSEKVAYGWFRRPLSTGLILASLVLSYGTPALALDSGALPSGGQVTSGTASISTSGNSMTIDQTTDRMIAEWDTFNIGSSASVTFNQPGASSAALNRITDQNPSEIYGALSGNGQVFLLNSAGVYFGATAQVDVGGLVASTLDLSNEDFLSGNYGFEGDTGNITNNGTVKGGYVAFIAPVIENSGTITADNGTVLMAAGDRVNLDFTGDGLVTFNVDEGAVDAQIANSGIIRAQDGVVYMTAVAAEDLTNAAVNNTGVIEATGLNAQGGRIVLEADQVINAGEIDAGGDTEGGDIALTASGMVMNTGSLSATGESGGSITVSGKSLVEAGSLDASGDSLGGDILLEATGAIEQTTASTVKADGEQAGTITVNAVGTGYISGTYSASGGQGGEISITSGDLTLAGAEVQADGDLGGGTVRIGGGWQGNDADMENAAETTINNAVITANAVENGDGGTVVIWSEEETIFAGTIEATGGASSGDGGQVEVSSAGTMSYGGTVDVTAASGEAGDLLLDPKNIEIVESVSGLSVITLGGYTPGESDYVGAYSVVGLTKDGSGTDRVVVASPNDDTAATNAGAVRLYDSTDGSLIATLTGSTENDQVGNKGVTALSNGNYVVISRNWNNGDAVYAGAVTWGNGETGISGTVSSSNSLVGTTAYNYVGYGGVTELSNGNYVVISYNWDNGDATNAGAVTWGNGETGISGAVSSSNSLVGSTALNQVGVGGVTELSNGNYVVISYNWDNGDATNAGAVTWGNGETGITGAVTSDNSLVGTTAYDYVGYGGVTALSNGNYVVLSYQWDNGDTADAGAVTWGNGETGISGEVSSSNSLVGTTADDQVGNKGVTVLSNGNYVVISKNWNNVIAADAGAVTWGNGETGISGEVSSSNSLVGTRAYNYVGYGGVTALSNGNYVVLSYLWDSVDATEVGAVTWGNGETGISGEISSSNSLVGTTSDDKVGLGKVTELSNGNYVVLSPCWNNGDAADAGAVTWVNGETGITGAVTSDNSLVGTSAEDSVGFGGVTALSNGNYVVISKNWNNGDAYDAGAVTWGNGETGISGEVTSSNSLVGSTADDKVGYGGVTELSNCNYVVRSYYWDNGDAADAGAMTWVNGETGITGAVTSDNSLVGATAYDYVGYGGVTALSNGNYVVLSYQWDNGDATDAGAVTWGNGETGISGEVSSSNSLVGTSADDKVGYGGVTALSNGDYVVLSYQWDNGDAADAGAVTWVNGETGISGEVTSSNSLVGTSADDQVGYGGVTELSNGNYVVLSPCWNNGDATYAGAVTWGNGETGISGEVTSSNSLVGTTAGDMVGCGGVTALSNDTVLVKSPYCDVDGVTDAGRVDIITGQFTADTLDNPYTFTTNSSGSSTILASDVLTILDTGATVTLQASNDITLSSDLIADNSSGDGGDLILQAGRSILLNGSITTDNGDITITANETAEAGVVDDEREEGEAVIAMASDATIDAGAGTVSMTIEEGTDKTYSASGDITLTNITAGTIKAINSGVTTGSGIVLNGALTASGTGDAIVLAGSVFVNNGGASALSAENGRWLVWSGSPADDERGGLSYDFKQYNAVYGTTAVAGEDDESGFLYSLTPTITASLTGIVEKTYDGTAIADISTANLAYSGTVYGDTVSLSVASGAYDDAGAGSGKGVTANGIAIAEAGNGTVIVYGYQLADTTVSGDVGVIDKANLTVTAKDDSGTYDGTAYTGGNGVSYSGFVTGEDSSVLGGDLSYGGDSQGAVNPGTYTITASGLNSDNYEIAYNNGALTVDKAALTVTANDDSMTYDGTAYTGGNDVSYSGFVTGEDESVLTGAVSYGGTSQGATEAGSYSIIPAGLSSDNYLISFVDGLLTIGYQSDGVLEAVEASLVNTGTGQNGTGEGVGAGGNSMIRTAMYMGPGTGSSTLATYGNSGVLNQPLQTNGPITLSSNGSVSTVTLSQAEGASTLSIGEGGENDTLTEVGALSVFSMDNGGGVELQGSYIVSEGGSSISLTETAMGQDFTLDETGIDSAESVSFNITLADGTTMAMTAAVTENGVIVISGSYNIRGLDVDQAVLMAMEVAKEELNVDIKEIKSVLLNMGYGKKGRDMATI